VLPVPVRSALLRRVDALKRLHRLGVIRTNGPLAGQFGEGVAARYLGLRLVGNTVQKGHDAVDGAGKTFQIKARVMSGKRANTGFGFRRPIHHFDFLIGVLVSPTSEVLAIIRVPYAAVRRHARRNRQSNSVRWTPGTRRAPWVEVLYSDHKTVAARPRRA